MTTHAQNIARAFSLLNNPGEDRLPLDRAFDVYLMSAAGASVDLQLSGGNWLVPSTPIELSPEAKDVTLWSDPADADASFVPAFVEYRDSTADSSYPWKRVEVVNFAALGDVLREGRPAVAFYNTGEGTRIAFSDDPTGFDFRVWPEPAGEPEDLTESPQLAEPLHHVLSVETALGCADLTILPTDEVGGSYRTWIAERKASLADLRAIWQDRFRKFRSMSRNPGPVSKKGFRPGCSEPDVWVGQSGTWYRGG